MIFDFLHCQSCRWSLASGSGPGVLARQSTPAVAAGSWSRWRAVLREPKWEPTVIGVSCREHVSESQLPGKAGILCYAPSPFTADI